HLAERVDYFRVVASLREARVPSRGASGLPSGRWRKRGDGGPACWAAVVAPQLPCRCQLGRFGSSVSAGAHQAVASTCWRRFRQEDRPRNDRPTTDSTIVEGSGAFWMFSGRTATVTAMLPELSEPGGPGGV